MMIPENCTIRNGAIALPQNATVSIPNGEHEIFTVIREIAHCRAQSSILSAQLRARLISCGLSGFDEPPVSHVCCCGMEVRSLLGLQLEGPRSS